jgi:hypothetical protein
MGRVEVTISTGIISTTLFVGDITSSLEEQPNENDDDDDDGEEQEEEEGEREESATISKIQRSINQFTRIC